ncbi:MAG: sigma-54 dependent transcriptional regulator [Candidatus Latescibacteria bacterium]|nr:sigma-54 dependent transcriptional regulator [Candidatus Latescibacterota bacterium]
MPDTTGPRILVVDDNRQLRRLFALYLADEGFAISEADDGQAALDHCAREGCDLVLLDLRMPGLGGLEVLARLREDDPDRPVIVVSGTGEVDDVIAALRAGASDYLLKPVEDLAILLYAVRRALERSDLLQENRRHREHLEQEVRERTVELTAANSELQELRRQLEQENEYLREEVGSTAPVSGMIGDSPAMRRLLREIELVAPTGANVLISGESGTGKELVARAIHDRSPRHERPLIKVNCASIPRELFESEFFGHVRGSFTGAVRDRVGRFQLADHGTLFLDEVGEIPVELQGKLLRVLQEGEFERVGEDHTRSVEVRIIAATNRDLLHEVEQGRFRRDLYFRLNVYPVVVPALREHLEDLPALAEHFLGQSCRRLGTEPQSLRRKHIAQLQAYAWPGNVRELQNTMERAAIVSQCGEMSFDLGATTGAAATVARESAAAGEVLTDAQLRGFERENTLRALNAADWRITGEGGAAELLDLPPSTLASRIKALGLKREEA